MKSIVISASETIPVSTQISSFVLDQATDLEAALQRRLREDGELEAQSSLHLELCDVGFKAYCIQYIGCTWIACRMK